MDVETSAQLRIFDAFSQPVVLIRDQSVLYINRAAADLGAEPGVPAETVTACAPDGETVLNLGQTQVRMQEYPYAGGKMYIAEPTWQGARLRAETLVSIAQAIRTPLTNLFTVSSPLFLALEEMEDPAISRAMASLNRSFYQLLHLMCNLSDAPAAVGGKTAVLREKLDLREFAAKLFEKAEPLCETCGVRLRCDFPEKPVQAWADRKKLSRVIYNLLANAMKYTPKDGEITLRLQKTERFAIFEVHDGGDAKERLDKTFESFTREPTLEELNAGAGFGLAIVRAIASAHGGTLMIGAEPTGGTTATLSVSLRAPGRQGQTLHSPLAAFDYTGGYRQELIELADILPASVYDSMNVN